MRALSSRWLFIVLPAFLLVGEASPPQQRALGVGTPITLLRTPNQGIQPQVARDAQGNLHLLYFKGEASHGDLFYVRLDPDGRFSQPLAVNSQPGSAMATGSMRGGHIAIGGRGRVHVAWHASDKAMRASGAGATVLYARMNDAGTQFEAERRIAPASVDLDGGTVAADASGNVYVAWHAGGPGTKGEGDRRVWVARSTDAGRTFSAAKPVSEPTTGACGCCEVSALADDRSTLYMLYRSATDIVHRDTYLLTSHDAATSFTSEKIQGWDIGACPMSTFGLTESEGGVLAAWETDGRVQWLRIAPATGRRSDIVVAPDARGSEGAALRGGIRGPETGARREARREPVDDRKHPVVAGNVRGETILAWTEGTAWNKGGRLAWQVFDRDGKPTAARGQAPGVPTWSLVAVGARPDGGFVIVY